MKKRIAALTLLASLAIGSSSTLAADFSDYSLRTRADQIVTMGEKTVVLHISGKQTPDNVSVEGITYPSKFVPVKDLFRYTSSTVQWDNSRKVATVANQGKKLLLNYSNKPLTPGEGEVVAPRTWITMQNGQAMIDVYVLTYILHRYGNVNVDGKRYEDKEREEWNKKLNFLGILYAEWLPEVKAERMHIYVSLP
ncbi:hypothetical protein B9G55_06600 [Saccharibacillus sp. O16]|nr:hypothetical protein B9G55_06600 [Saccharibacillus sp. O16]